MTDVANCGSFIVLIKPVFLVIPVKIKLMIRIVRVVSFFVLQRGPLEDKHTLLWADSGTKEK